jgi:hypothetical protein
MNNSCLFCQRHMKDDDRFLWHAGVQVHKTPSIRTNSRLRTTKNVTLT